MAKNLIYIVGDKTDMHDTVKAVLVSEGYEVKAFSDEHSAFSAFSENAPDMLIIDVGTSGANWSSVCSSFRRKSNIPIIIMSAQKTEADIIAGLASGCDDYLIKPCSSLVLIGRIKSLFRRIELDKATVFTDNITYVSDIILDVGSKQAFIGEKNIKLTAMEFSFLFYLANNKSRSISRRELLDKVWGFENEVETRATDDMMKRIRKKLSNAGSSLKIETVWGFGFKIV